ncbi:MAG: enoyl-CoA hydratase/isomerase family protein [Deltaproteobacteria bacterium]|nr:enoyl-CoA hydratase/isomerase family protein [Deltaproteobacteria bacterium]
MSYEQIIFEVKENIGIIRLNRPEKKNAFSPKMDEELLDVMIRIEKDPEIRGVLFTGSGDSFSAGLDLDLSFLQTMEESDSKNFRRVMDPILEWSQKLYNLKRPTVAAVNGHTYGGGIVQVSICDVAIASDRAKFGLSEINFAHFPAGGTTWAVSHFLLPKHFEYLCLSGDRIDAEEAFRMGLVTKVVPHDQLEEEAWKMVKKLANKHPSAYKTAKTMCRMTRHMQYWEAIELEMAHIHENYFLSEGEMVKIALKQFKEKKIKTGTGETYKKEK